MTTIDRVLEPPWQAGAAARGDGPVPEVSVVATGVSAREQFHLFAVRHTAALHRIAYLLCGDDHRAHDLTQIALEKTYRHWHRVKDGNPFGYARRVLSTARIDGWRSTRREVLRSPEGLAMQQPGRGAVGDGSATVAARRILTGPPPARPARPAPVRTAR